MSTASQITEESTASQITKASTASQIVEAITNYANAWNDPDGERRRALVEIAFAEDGLFVDPVARVAGREALLDHMAEFHRTRSGATFELASKIDTHHRVHRFRWRMRGSNGAVLLEATNFGRSNDAGLLVEMVDFFGPLPGSKS